MDFQSFHASAYWYDTGLLAQYTNVPDYAEFNFFIRLISLLVPS